MLGPIRPTWAAGCHADSPSHTAASLLPALQPQPEGRRTEATAPPRLGAVARAKEVERTRPGPPWGLAGRGRGRLCFPACRVTGLGGLRSPPDRGQARVPVRLHALSDVACRKCGFLASRWTTPTPRPGRMTPRRAWKRRSRHTRWRLFPTVKGPSPAPALPARRRAWSRGGSASHRAPLREPVLPGFVLPRSWTSS